MFSDWRSYEIILVTGPQRSGTRIVSRMAAADTGYTYIDENRFGVRERSIFEHVLKVQTNIVVQCPTMSRWIHEYTNDRTLIVFMIRDIDDIVASEQRVGWTNGPYFELMNYGYSSRKAVSFRRRGGHVAPIKYAYWLTKQRGRIKHYVELQYESLSSHPLWISKEQRVNFAPDQTEL